MNRTARTVAAGVLDVGLIALLAFAGFRLAVVAAPCKNESSCPLLTPLVVIFVIVAVLVYVVPPYLVWRESLARHLLDVDR